MKHISRLTIPINDSVLCLACSGAADRLLEAFPDAEINGEWVEVTEYRHFVNFLRENATDGATAETMLRQLRSKHIAHGPTCRFRIPASEIRQEIRGSFNRWGFTFTSLQPFHPVVLSQIKAFLDSFGIGEFECYTEEGPDTATNLPEP